MRQMAILALAVAVALFCSASANAAIQLIANGGFEAGNAGWTDNGNVVYTGYYDLTGNSNPGVTAFGSTMAVLSGVNPALNASLSQPTLLSSATSDATISFNYQLEALDRSWLPWPLDTLVAEELDFLRVWAGDDLIYSQQMDDLYELSILGFIDPDSSQTGWLSANVVVPLAQLQSLSPPITIEFVTDNLDTLGAQDFVVYLDNVSVEVDGTVPEPASVAIWGALGGIGLVVARRRMRKAA